MSADLFFYILQNLLCALILLVVVVTIFLEYNIDSKTKSFAFSCIMFAGSMFCNSFGHLIVHNHPEISRFIFDVNTFFLCMAVYFWCIYAFYSLNSRMAYRFEGRISLFAFYVAIALFSIISGSYYVDSRGFHGTSLFIDIYFIAHFFPFFIGIKAFVRSMKRKHYINRHEYFFIGLFSIIPILPSILEKMYGIGTFRTAAIILTFLLIYANMMKNRISLDSLTGISNRTVLCKKIGKAIENRDYSEYLFMIDANKFKQLNDSYGHVAGDNVLRLIADVLKTTVPGNMYVSRYAGDEFALLGPLSSDSDAEVLKKKISDRLCEKCNENMQSWNVSVSIGFSRLDSGILSIPDFIASADKKLYDAKHELDA